MFAEYRIKEMMITKNTRPPIAIDEEHSIIDVWNTFTVSQGSEMFDKGSLTLLQFFILAGA